jgi:hypothetical protein
MKRLHAWIIALSISLLAGAAFAQGVDHSQFRRSSLKAQSTALAARAAQTYVKPPAKFGDAIYDTEAPHWVAQATYTGVIRPLAPDERRYVASYFRSMKVEQAARAFDKAMLFQSDGHNYWLPVETPIVPYFAKELKRRQKIDLYVVQPGGTRRTSGWEWLFLVEDFQAADGG